jgi:hypothetical protein
VHYFISTPFAAVRRFPICLGTCLLALTFANPVFAAEPSTSPGAANKEDGTPETSRFRDPEDDRFDVGAFLDSAYGFLPIVTPITEPAVGYGATAALVFIDRKEPSSDGKPQRPNIAVAGGLATENGTRGLFAAHLGSWRDGRLRTLAAVADADINLAFFGLGGDGYANDRSIEYEIAARGGVAGGNLRLGSSSMWLGLRYVLANTTVRAAETESALSGIPLNDRELGLAALTPSFTLDTRNSFFTPTRGWYVDLSVPVFREALGGDRDFEKATLTAIHYRPLSEAWFFGIRATARTSSDGTPFFLRPFVSLRGVPAMRYQAEQAGEVEAELRWQFHPRYSLVGFAGTGMARSNNRLKDSSESVVSYGGGFRYLIARRHGLHMGLDIGFGPDDTAVYIIFGSAWNRP